MKDIKFEEVISTKKQIEGLYALLKKRTYGISHKKLPSFVEHENFVRNNPYKYWFMILKKNQAIGTIYLNYDNSIGLNVVSMSEKIMSACIDFAINNFSPEAEKKSKISKDMFINVHARNSEMIDVLEKMHLEPIQLSYRLPSKEQNEN